MENNFEIIFEPEGKKVLASRGETILEAANRAGIGIRAECGGRGICGKCKVKILCKSSVNDLTDNEKRLLTSEEILTNYRLACQAKIVGALTIYTLAENRGRKRRIQVKGISRHVKLDPFIKKIRVTVAAPSLSDIRSDLDRLLDSLKQLGLRDIRIEYELLKDLPEILREAQWKPIVTVWDNSRIIAIESTNTMHNFYGMAIDIGTSKIVGQLVDLFNGRILTTGSIENPQMIYGEDIISRVSHASSNPGGLGELQSSIIEGLNEVILDCCKSAGISPENIYEITIVGNTVMHHLFLGIQPKYVALAPFTPVVKKAMNVSAREVNFKINPYANIHVLPIIAGFVGADNVADILSTRIHKTKEMSLLLDIGTNTEITLGNRDGLLSCSCASGPAFEGGHIKYGIKAVTGAIERVKIDAKTLDAEYNTIGNAKPVGICGSGLVDIIAELLKCSLLSKTGRLNKDVAGEKIRERDGLMEYVIVPKGDSGLKEDIVITQRDIRELQLAKAAIHTGCQILMRRKGIKVEDIERVFIAGAFGNYLNLDNAKAIGLIPNVPSEKALFVGNAAVSGARLALISRKERAEAERVSNIVQYLELSVDPDFESEFISSIKFP